MKSSADVAALIDSAIETFGRIDVTVNIPGRFCQLHSIIDGTEEQHDRTMAVNEKGVWLGSNYALTAMVGQGLDEAGYRGNIVNIASVEPGTAR